MWVDDLVADHPITEESKKKVMDWWDEHGKTMGGFKWHSMMDYVPRYLGYGIQWDYTQRRNNMNSCVWEKWLGEFRGTRGSFRKRLKGYLKEIDAEVMERYGDLKSAEEEIKVLKNDMRQVGEAIVELRGRLGDHTREDLHEWKIKVHEMQEQLDALYEHFGLETVVQTREEKLVCRKKKEKK